MKSSEVKVGEVYTHMLEGRPWLVKVTSKFSDPPNDPKNCRHGWEGVTPENGEPCWGWTDELRAEVTR